MNQSWIVIGNDVIDLKLAATQSNWQRRGYLDKLFTPAEKQFILSSPNPEIMVWVLWSMKEAAYKIYNRQTGERGFFPYKLVCCNIKDNDSALSGEVSISNSTYYCKTAIEENQLHTIAVTVKSDFKKLSDVENAKVQKDSMGLPFISTGGISVPVSKSHHGNYERVVALF